MSQPYRSASLEELAQRVVEQRDDAKRRLARFTSLFRRCLPGPMATRIAELERAVAQVRVESHEALGESERLVEEFALAVNAAENEELSVAVELSRKTPGFAWPARFVPCAEQSFLDDVRLALMADQIVKVLGDRKAVRGFFWIPNEGVNANGHPLLSLACAFVAEGDQPLVIEVHASFIGLRMDFESARVHTFVARGFPDVVLSMSASSPLFDGLRTWLFGRRSGVAVGDAEFDDFFRVEMSDPLHIAFIFPKPVRVRLMALNDGAVAAEAASGRFTLAFDPFAKEALARAIYIALHMRKINWKWPLVQD